MADALMATRSMRRSDLVLRGAQSICIVSIAILTIAGANGYNGVVLGGVLLFTCFVAGIVAFVSTFDELSVQQRDLFRWIAAGAGLGAVAKISWTLHFISNGVRPPFPALADYLLLGAELAVVAGFVRMLYMSRAGVKLEAFADLILIAVATAVFTAWAAQLALSGSQPLHTPMDVLACAAILGFVSALDLRRSLSTLELKIAERTAALSGTVEELKGVITEERAMRAQIIERERLASIGSIVGGVAHEINNPLSSISAFAQLLLNEDDLTASQRESLEAIYAEAMRAANVIMDLRAFARRSAPESRAVDLNEIISRTVRLRSYQMDTGNVRVDTTLDPDLPMVTGDPQQLQQVVVNLMSSAIASMKDGGRLLIETCAARSTESRRVLVEFTDTGPGIPEDLRERIFDPFLAPQGYGEGVGMGLSVSFGIVAAHGGSLRLADGSRGKTKFVVELPPARWQPEAGGPHTPESTGSLARVPGATSTSS